MGARKLISSAICILFSMHSYAQLQTMGTATADATNTCFTLTQNVGNSAGAVWEQTPIDLTQSFSFDLTMNLGCNDGGGADGIVFAQQALGHSDVKTTMGYYHSDREALRDAMTRQFHVSSHLQNHHKTREGKMN